MSTIFSSFDVSNWSIPYSEYVSSMSFAEDPNCYFSFFLVTALKYILLRNVFLYHTMKEVAMGIESTDIAWAATRRRWHRKRNLPPPPTPPRISRPPQNALQAILVEFHLEFAHFDGYYGRFFVKSYGCGNSVSRSLPPRCIFRLILLLILRRCNCAHSPCRISRCSLIYINFFWNRFLRAFWIVY